MATALLCCPNCAARAPAYATWCSLCFTSLLEPVTGPSDQSDPSDPADPSSAIDDDPAQDPPADASGGRHAAPASHAADPAHPDFDLDIAMLGAEGASGRSLLEVSTGRRVAFAAGGMVLLTVLMLGGLTLIGTLLL